MEVSLLHATRLVYFLIIRNQNTKQARISSVIYTEEAGLKHTYTYTLKTVDSDEILAAFVYSVRRVSEYSSSFIDLKDYTRKDIGFTQRDHISQ